MKQNRSNFLKNVSNFYLRDTEATFVWLIKKGQWKQLSQCDQWRHSCRTHFKKFHGKLIMLMSISTKQIQKSWKAIFYFFIIINVFISKKMHRDTNSSNTLLWFTYWKARQFEWKSKANEKKNRILTMSINEATGFFFIYSFIFQENRLSYLVHFLISTSIHAVDSLQYNVFA